MIHVFAVQVCNDSGYHYSTCVSCVLLSFNRPKLYSFGSFSLLTTPYFPDAADFSQKDKPSVLYIVSKRAKCFPWELVETRNRGKRRINITLTFAAQH